MRFYFLLSLALFMNPLWGDVISSREGHLLGGLHGGSYQVRYNNADGTLDTDEVFKTIDGFGGGVHMGADWSSAGGFYLAALLGYEYTGVSKTETISGFVFNQSMKNSFFFDVNIGGGHTSCIFLILGVVQTKEELSLAIPTPLGVPLYLSSKLSMVRPKFGLGGRFMLFDNVAMSASATFYADSQLWAKREIKAKLGKTPYILPEKDRKKLDKESTASVLVATQLLIGISYALPVRAVF